MTARPDNLATPIIHRIDYRARRQCLEAFAQDCPDIQLELHESVLGDPLMPANFVAMAAPAHPLLQLELEMILEDLRQHRHLLSRDSGSSRTRKLACQSAQTRWTMSHKATSFRAARMGLGFAWYPEEVIREELAAGQLVHLHLALAQGAQQAGALYLVFAGPDAAGPGAQRLAELIRNASSQ
ncbi:MAG: hypothetical protein EA417_17305 [Gammaproteobacteria bacterium]|nr:MAG: hypothetical protein EA417_17305 [Gammaproteobacteria bacterium]